MKIEFNGRVVAGFVLGMVCGAVALAAFAVNPVGRIQRQRDEATKNLADMTAERDRLLGVSQQMFRRINELTTQRTGQATAAPQDPAVQVLNAVRPGLGTALGAVANAAQKAEADKAAKAGVDQRALHQALLRQETEKHCPSGHCAACPDGWKLFSTDRETYCVREQCPHGTTAQTSENWQGARCVANDN